MWVIGYSFIFHEKFWPMTLVDWLILVGTLGAIVGYGAWKNRKNNSISDYLKGGNSARWWTVGLSVMATQASAITFLSTPGQAFHDGMGFCPVLLWIPFRCNYHLPLFYSPLPQVEGLYRL